eukprot:TRINITY_DN3878_c0_g1_i2.p1 TRINITY_DN3878_c0_g1~~TRINITY_DN3878_c0_g1_i2.p1  ORF type:complete len:517 (-),score=97.43 TRINITY_DN3878_c0_g1_i2:1032-2582(-)
MFRCLAFCALRVARVLPRASPALIARWAAPPIAVRYKSSVDDIRTSVEKAQGATKGKHCPGCGAVLQMVNPAGIGYISAKSTPAKALLSPVGLELEGGAPLCYRCHHLTYHRKDVGIRIPFDDFRSTMTQIGTTHALIVKIVDITDFYGSFVSDISSVIGTNPVILILNKFDLLPKSAKLHEARISAWCRHMAKELGLTNPLLGVHLVSSHTGHNVAEALKDIQTSHGGRDVYVVGCTNAGKSSFLNKILVQIDNDETRAKLKQLRESKAQAVAAQVLAQESAASGIPDPPIDESLIPEGIPDEEDLLGKKRQKLTTSIIPGTTLNLIKVSLGKGQFLMDTPGLVNHHQLTMRLNTAELKACLPSSRFNPRAYAMKPGKSMFLGGFVRMDLVSGPEGTLVQPFVSKAIKVHFTDTKNAATIYATHAGAMLSPPFDKARALAEFALSETTARAMKFNGHTWRQSTGDVAISGLGWVSVQARGEFEFRITVPAGVGVMQRQPFLPFEVNPNNVTKFFG